MSAFAECQVVSVHHWTDSLFSFKVQRDPTFRFENGHFAMIGLQVDGKPLVRAYSMASANYEDLLEFLSIKVANGPLTSRLQHIKPGDKILLGRKATGTLVLDNLLPGRTLYLFATGTGLAPFMSLIKDPSVYERFERVVLTHTVRTVGELAYRDYITGGLLEDEFIGEQARAKLTYYPTVTREPFETEGRITDLIRSGRFHKDIGTEPLNPAVDRAMVCGGPDMLVETVELLQGLGFKEGSSNEPGHYVIEKAFVEK
ncbi:MAG TPA: ferredoxin--NADP reductase [Azospirillaceae bacterium]|nr:ferredoxin--NADP reductase [Azospirillaceae bacterium]